ncbi:MAG: 30S ribosome-binding factor RbfA, partial [Actinobacteria bacterium]|nr:30S ribosome-binding factor RbfA [Actinomycetota bacterium]
ILCLNFNQIQLKVLYIMDRNKKIEIDLIREISFILNSKVKDPRIGFVTLTYVKLSADYHYMDIYFTVLNKEENLKSCLEGLNKSKGFIKKNLLERIKLRTVPEIKFIYDETIEKGTKIIEILEKIKLKEIES